MTAEFRGPTTDLASWTISNGRISATSHPIHFLFGSRVGFSGSEDWMVLFPVGSNPRWLLATILENFKCPYRIEWRYKFLVGVFGIGWRCARTTWDWSQSEIFVVHCYVLPSSGPIHRRPWDNLKTVVTLTAILRHWSDSQNTYDVS